MDRKAGLGAGRVGGLEGRQKTNTQIDRNNTESQTDRWTDMENRLEGRQKTDREAGGRRGLGQAG